MKSKASTFTSILLLIFFSVFLFFPGSGVRAALQPGDPGPESAGVATPVPPSTPDQTDGTGSIFPERSTQVVPAGVPLAAPRGAQADSTPPIVNFWYGSNQVFGKYGTSQEWINLLGNASDPESTVISLVYSLNGGPASALTIGSDQRRVYYPGDFNVELDKDTLNDGLNTVVISAMNGEGLVTQSTVNLQYYKHNVWPLNYSIAWNANTNPQEVLQIVDGKWKIVSLTTSQGNGYGIRTDQMGYDRVLAIGDIAWDDYEITVPIKIHAIDNDIFGDLESFAPGLGINMRWKGHTDDPVACPQPHCGWLPMGGSNWYEWHNDGQNILKITAPPPSGEAWTDTIEFVTGSTYWFKARVQTTGGSSSLYNLKVWEDGDPEPGSWTLSRQTNSGNEMTGSPILVAHHVDATFGNITIKSLNPNNYLLNTATEGSGSVSANPSLSTYPKWSQASLTALPASGWTFSDWSGAAGGSANPITITIKGDTIVTATFNPIEYTLTVNTQGDGQVTKTPDTATYHYGDQVTLTAAPGSGWQFSAWGGDVTGTQNPKTVTVTGNLVVTATFEPALPQTYTLTTTVLGKGTVTKNPDKPIYQHGDWVTLLAKPDTGWRFVGWSGDVSGAGSVKNVQVTTNLHAIATFMNDNDQSYQITLPVILRAP